MPDHRRTTLRRSPSSNTRVCVFAVAMLGSLALASHVFAQKPDVIEVEGQPLAANIQPVQQALDHLGAPLPPALQDALAVAAAAYKE